jgi:hypothetical protein
VSEVTLELLHSLFPMYGAASLLAFASDTHLWLIVILKSGMPEYVCLKPLQGDAERLGRIVFLVLQLSERPRCAVGTILAFGTDCID